MKAKGKSTAAPGAPEPCTTPAKWPFDFAAEACAGAARELERLALHDGIALDPTEVEFIVAVLRELAERRDPRKLIDGRVKMDGLRERAAQAVMRAIYKEGCGSMAAAFDIADKELGGIGSRNIEGAWNDYWTARGVSFVPPWVMKGKAPKRRPRTKK
jgi:hypothetical protein